MTPSPTTNLNDLVFGVEDAARLHQFTFVLDDGDFTLDAVAPEPSTKSWYLSPESVTVQPSSSVVSSGAARQRDLVTWVVGVMNADAVASRARQRIVVSERLLSECL